jgi:cytochrome b
MNATPVSHAENQTFAVPPTRRVVDAPTRAFHWLLALSFAGAYLTADGERWRLVHVTLGYTVIGLVVARLLWGFVGPKPSRLSTWVAKVRGLPALVRSLSQNGWPGRPQIETATRVFNTTAIVALMALSLAVTATGYLLFNDLAGEWLEEVHELLGNAMLMVVLTHVGLVLVSSLMRGRQQWLAMVTGRVPGRGPDLVKRNLFPLAVLMLAAVLSFWAWQWQNAPQGLTSTRQESSEEDD